MLLQVSATLHQPYELETGGRPVSQQPKTRCFQWVTDLETVQAKAVIEYPVYWERSEQNVQHVVLHYFVARLHLTSLKDKAQPLGVRYQKFTNLHSNNCQSKLEICMSCIQWLPKLSHQVQGPYVDIECKQVMYGLLGASRYVYDHQNTTHKTGIYLKR